MVGGDDGLKNYDALYQNFDSEIMRQVRREAYGEDLGQHSWVLTKDLEQDLALLRLTGSAWLLDLGCGPCGPLEFVVSRVRCRCVGVDLSQPALDAGDQRLASAGLSGLVKLRQHDLNTPLPLATATFDAVMSFDVILHLKDRRAVFSEVARLLKPGGLFLFTDAAVLIGAISSEQVRTRSIHGTTQLVSADFNVNALKSAGLRLLEAQDRTGSLLRCARGRRQARDARRPELERLEGPKEFSLEQRYLDTVITLAETQALSRWMYLSERV
jgi:cyclopropane fatty-acyl-phospholipid synthase-like methyltransferase